MLAPRHGDFAEEAAVRRRRLGVVQHPVPGRREVIEVHHPVRREGVLADRDQPR